jgi:hypothetical protein
MDPIGAHDAILAAQGSHDHGAMFGEQNPLGNRGVDDKRISEFIGAAVDLCMVCHDVQLTLLAEDPVSAARVVEQGMYRRQPCLGRPSGVTGRSERPREDDLGVPQARGGQGRRKQRGDVRPLQGDGTGRPACRAHLSRRNPDLRVAGRLTPLTEPGTGQCRLATYPA